MNMAKPITYLNVPYAEKDAAKALGARWDATNKKWYVPVGKNIEPFAQWQTDFVPRQKESPITTDNPASKPAATQNNPSAGQTSGVFTYPSIADFVPYSGNEPPWNE